MGTRKRGTELVFNLQWRNKPDNGGDKSNVIGIYDSPATILNFETFKSYLLKNSGVAGDDVKVAFLTDNGQEWVIDSQTTFQIALCAFRLKARLGEVIFLKLDKISSDRKMPQCTTSVSDVQTQSEYESLQNGLDIAPEWFVAYMQQFKRELVEEVTWGVTENLSSLAVAKEKEAVAAAAPIPIVYNCSKKSSKHDCQKKTKRHLHGDSGSDSKEVLKSTSNKLDRKLESKLDKLDAKTKKIKEKQLALINKTFNRSERTFAKITRPPPPVPVQLTTDGASAAANDNPQEHYYEEKATETVVLNAALENETHGFVQHLLGGESYLHKWNVVNNGLIPWTRDTELRWTWGSAELKPSTMVIRCPPLNPGEKGTLTVVFHIPEYPGQYESYWNFYDKEVRFGQWLSCCIVVDPPITADYALIPKKAKIEKPEPQQPTAESYTVTESAISKQLEELKLKEDHLFNTYERCFQTKPIYGITESELIVDLSKTSKSAEVATAATGNDEDNNNVEKKEYENSSDSSSVSSGYDVLTAPITDDKEEEDVATGYVYITINGDKLPVPKFILRPDFLATAEEAPGPLQSMDFPAPVMQQTVQETEPKPAEPETVACSPDSQPPAQAPETQMNISQQLQQQILELEQNIEGTRNMLSHCSATGSCYSEVNAELNKSRLFIFPRNNPGYEVVGAKEEGVGEQEDGKENAAAASAPPENIWEHSETKYIWPNEATRDEYLKFNPYEKPKKHISQASAATSTPSQEQQQQQHIPHVPNFQQTPRTSPSAPQQPKRSPTASTNSGARTPPPKQETRSPSYTPPTSPQLHVLPENLVSGAVHVASSALNTARSVINMMIPPKSEGKWENGHWVGENPESKRAKNLRILTDMGFWDMDLNATLLARYKDDVNRVVNELLHQ